MKINNAIHENSFAEVIASNLDHFIAQCWRWDNFPEFGSLVHVTNETTTIIGCVTQVETGSIDPMRSPFPYQKTELELKAEQPQIFEFLKTTFTVQILGSHENDQLITYTLPKKPCKIHSFVGNCTDEIKKNFFKKTSFLPILFSFSNQIQNIDELLLAMIQNLLQKKLIDQDFFESLCDTYSLLIGNDYRRIKLFLQRIQNII